MEWLDGAVSESCDRLHPGEHLQARLRLPCFRCLGPEPIDERLQMTAALFLLAPLFRENGLLLAPLPLEAAVIAAKQRELHLLEAQDVIGDRVKEVAVVADHDQRRGIGL